MGNVAETLPVTDVSGAPPGLGAAPRASGPVAAGRHLMFRVMISFLADGSKVSRGRCDFS